MGDWRLRAVLLMVMWGSFASAHTIRLVQDFLAISNALRTYQTNAGRYPTDEEGLKALVEKPASYPQGRHWQRVMLKIPERSLG
ncbi:MAG: hypothetical protein EOP83_03160 [Verrucomicrobiaceae bacterium]|nr:MAG: hypothetical protein EOP83_03160 [Verrucomicrobiaceae bacterium]